MFELLSRRGAPRTAELTSAQDRLEGAKRALATYRDNTALQRTLGDDDFRAGLEVRRDRVERTLIALVQARNRHAIGELPPRAELEINWPRMTIGERRQTIGRVVECVFVARGRRHVDERVAVFPVGDPPIDLPRPGDEHAPVRSLDVAAFMTTEARSVSPVRWSRARIARDLRDFTRERANWPTPSAFQEAGPAGLHVQVVLHGGDAYWAARLGLHFRNGPAHHRTWTEHRIRATLATYLADKATWPTVAEFQADGMRALRTAIQRNGGVDHWATEYDLPRPHRHNGRHGYWTDQRIRAQLADICRGRTTFPGRKHLAAIGLAGMVQAMARRRRLDAWAHEMGLPRQPPGGPRGPRKH
jgi:hypothetical protein